VLFANKKPRLSPYIKPIFDIYIMRAIGYVGPTQRQGQSAARAPKGYRSVSVPETIGTIGTAETSGTEASVVERLKRLELLERPERLEQASLSVFKAMDGSIRRSNGKFFPTIPDDSTGFEAS